MAFKDLMDKASSLAGAGKEDEFESPYAYKAGFRANAMRVLRLTKKPNKEEFLTVAKITAIGILFIGLIGYIVKSISVALGGL